VLTGGQSYSLTIQYYSFRTPYPTAKDCASFPIEIAIEPVKSITSKSIFSTPCPDSDSFPTQLDPAPYQTAAVLYHHPTDTQQPFNYTIPFSVSSYADFNFNLQYDFITSGLTFNLHGTVYKTGETHPITKIWPAQIGINHAYLFLTLDQGMIPFKL